MKIFILLVCCFIFGCDNTPSKFKSGQKVSIMGRKAVIGYETSGCSGAYWVNYFDELGVLHCDIIRENLIEDRND